MGIFVRNKVWSSNFNVGIFGGAHLFWEPGLQTASKPAMEIKPKTKELHDDRIRWPTIRSVWGVCFFFLKPRRKILDIREELGLQHWEIEVETGRGPTGRLADGFPQFSYQIYIYIFLENTCPRGPRDLM